MAIITITLLALATFGGAAIYFWNNIRESLATVFLPWLKENYNNEIYENINKFILMLDSTITVTRRALKKGWDTFKSIVLKRETVYTTTTKIDKVTGTRTTYIRNEDKVIKTTETSELDIDELPDDVRRQFIYEITKNAHGTNKQYSFTVDEKKEIFEKAKEQLIIAN